MNSNNIMRDVGPRLVDGNAGVEVPDPVLEIVKAIAADIHAFLGRWSSEHQRTEGSESRLESEHALRQKMVKFQAQKQHWEESCTVEAQRMQESMNHLTESWLRLEAEQRKMLAARDRNRITADRASAVVAKENVTNSKERGLLSQTLSGRVSRDAASDSAPVDFSFQQIQREVQSLRRNERQV